jgi:maleylpyruvate isomerase
MDAPEWSTLADSAARFLDTAKALADNDVRGASALPGWTRAHVLTHVAQATDSRTGLLLAARAGRVGRQYPSEQARAEAIDAGASRSAQAIRADVHRAIQECLAAISDHPAELWDAPAIWLVGGRRPVRGVVPGLRPELEYHHVDLAADYQPAHWPDDFVAAQLSQVTELLNRRTDAPPMTLTGPTMLRIGTSPSVTVAGPSAAILAWLSGRSDGCDLQLDGTTLPTIPPLG